MRKMIDDYEIYNELGQGAFGFVVLARHYPVSKPQKSGENIQEEVEFSGSSSLQSSDQPGEELVAIKIIKK